MPMRTRTEAHYKTFVHLVDGNDNTCRQLVVDWLTPANGATPTSGLDARAERIVDAIVAAPKGPGCWNLYDQRSGYNERTHQQRLLRDDGSNTVTLADFGGVQ